MICRAATLPAAWPLMLMLPRVGASRPSSIFIRVDLPAPLCPARATVSPASMWMSTSLTAVNPAKVFCNCWAARMALMGIPAVKRRAFYHARAQAATVNVKRRIMPAPVGWRPL